MKAELSNNVNLNGRVATRVVDVASVDLGDGHFESIGDFDVSFLFSC